MCQIQNMHCIIIIINQMGTFLFNLDKDFLSIMYLIWTKYRL